MTTKKWGRKIGSATSAAETTASLQWGRPQRNYNILSSGINQGLCAIVLVLALVLNGCQPSTVISMLEAVVTSAEVALPIIGAATGMPIETSGRIIQYLQAVDAAVVEASSILAGPGTSAEKSLRIAQAFSQIAQGCNCVPAGTPQVVISVVDSVVKAVARFLTSVTPTQGLYAGRVAPPKIKVSAQDRAALTDIRKRAEQHLTQLQTVKGAKP